MKKTGICHYWFNSIFIKIYPHYINKSKPENCVYNVANKKKKIRMLAFNIYYCVFILIGINEIIKYKPK